METQTQHGAPFLFNYCHPLSCRPHYLLAMGAFPSPLALSLACLRLAYRALVSQYSARAMSSIRHSQNICNEWNTADREHSSVQLRSMLVSPKPLSDYGYLDFVRVCCSSQRHPLIHLFAVIFISSNILGSLFQIASLPVVILAPLGAVSLLWNALFARFILGDVFSLWMVLGTLLIAGGAVLIAIFGIVPEPTHSLEDLLILFARPTFVAYFSLLGFAVLVCLAIVSPTQCFRCGVADVLVI